MLPVHHLLLSVRRLLCAWARRTCQPTAALADHHRPAVRRAPRWVVLGVEMVEARLAANDMLHAATTALVAAAPAAWASESAPAVFGTLADNGAAATAAPAPMSLASAMSARDATSAWLASPPPSNDRAGPSVPLAADQVFANWASTPADAPFGRDALANAVATTPSDAGRAHLPPLPPLDALPGGGGGGGGGDSSGAQPAAGTGAGAGGGASAATNATAQANQDLFRAASMLPAKATPTATPVPASGAAGAAPLTTVASNEATPLAPFVPLLAASSATTTASASSAATPAPATAAASGYGQLPMAFVANHGQDSSTATFVGDGAGYHVGLDATGVTLRLPSGSAAATTLRLALLGSNAAASAQGQDALPGKANYFFGTDRSKWLTNLPTYRQVSFQGVYPGIDAWYSGSSQHQLEYTFVVHPGASADVIRLAVQGANGLRLDSSGNLVVHTAGGDLVQQAPVLYQLDSSGQRQSVAGNFVLHADGSLGFSVSAAYAHNRDLYIDPVVAYSSFYGSGTTTGTAIAVDSQGQAYLAGQAPGMGASASSAFVVKLNAAGTAVLFTTYLGGGTLPNTNTFANALAVAPDGSLAIAGGTTAADFATFQAFQPTFVGAQDAFAARLAPGGNGFIFSTFVGGHQSSTALGLVLDSGSNVYLTGSTSSPDFPLFQAAQSAFGGGNTDGFVTVLAANGASTAGTGVLSSTYVGGPGDDVGRAIAVDANTGNVDVVGATSSGTLLGQVPGHFGPGGGQDVLLAQLGPHGIGVNWVKELGGSGSDSGNALALDSAGNWFLTGTSSSTDLQTTPGAFQPALAGVSNAFVAEVTPSGSSMPLFTFDGGNGTDVGTGIALTPQGVAIDGTTTSSNFPTHTPFQASNAGNGDAFVSVLTAGGTGLSLSSYLGGSQADAANGLAADLQGNLYLVGTTASSNFLTVNPLQGSLGGSTNAFVTKVYGAPQVFAAAYNVPHDATLSVPASGVLSNAIAPSGGSLSAALASPAQHGTVTVQSNGSFIYVPAVHYVGPDSFTYTASDGSQTSSPATISLTVTDAHAPVAVADAYSVLHDQTLIVDASSGVLANDSDADPTDSLSAVLGAGPTHGTLTLNSNGSFLYQPAAGYTGSDQFTYVASDGVLTSATTTVTLSVTDTAPAVGNVSYGVQANQTMTVSAAAGVLANATDADGDPLSASVVSGGGPAHGALTLHADGSFIFTPTSGYSGPDSFTFAVSDGALTTTATASLTIHASNTAPVANADSYSIQHDQVLTVGGTGVMANDTDAEGDPLSASLVAGSGPAHGSLTLNSDGSFVYTPNAGYTGSDSFQYQANDGLASSAAATVTLNVIDASAPVAAAASYNVSRNNALTVGASTGVLANASDADGDTLSASLVAGSGPTHGELTLNGDGSFIYTPNTGYVGPDSFQYKANDGVQSSAAATVTLTVADTAPTASNTNFAVLHDTTLSVPAPGLLFTANDPDGDALTASLVGQAQHGTATVNANGSFTYVPAGGYTGPDSFTYQVSDGTLTSNVATVSLTVKATDTAPVAVADSYTLAHDTGLSTSASTGVLANDSDADGDPLSAVLVSGPTHGALTLNPDGSFVYTPTVAFAGPDSFTYKAFDGTTYSAVTTVSLTVTNDVPVAVADSYSVLLSGPTTVTASNGVLANDTDAEDALTASLVSGPAHGGVTLNSDGSFTFTPNGTFTGTDSFTYKASDGTNFSTPATVTLTTAPVASNDAYSINHDTTFTVAAAKGVLANDNLASGAPLTATRVSGPVHGSLSLNSDGSFTYVPAAHYVGLDSFTYTASGGGQSSNTATVSLNVVNTAPVATDDYYFPTENQTFTTAAGTGVLANDSDGEGDALTVQLVSGPAHGTLALGCNGLFTYTPTTGFYGTDTFTYQDTDGLATSGTATVTLTVNEVVSTTVSGKAVVSGDFNGDGKLDFAVANTASNSVSVFLGQGNGSFVKQPDISVGTAPVALAVGDFNGDGKVDLAVVDSGDNTVSILLGNGDGTFHVGQVLSMGSNPDAIVAAAFTSSGHLDLAVANRGSNTVTLFRGNGDGTFTTGTTVSVGIAPDGLAVGDFNGDGKMDLAVANYGSANVSVLLGNGSGGFATPVNYAVGTNPAAVVAADFNKDGALDLAVANSGSNTISLLFGVGDGTFLVPMDYPVGSQPVGLAVGDFWEEAGAAGTGNVDLAIANQGAGTVSLLLNPGTLSAGWTDVIATLPSAASLVVGNFAGAGSTAVVALASAAAANGSLVYAPAPVGPSLPTATSLPISKAPVNNVAAAASASVAAWSNTRGQVAISVYRGASTGAFMLPIQYARVSGLALSPNGKYLAVAVAIPDPSDQDFEKGYVDIWEISGKTATRKYSTNEEAGPVLAVTFSPNSQYFALTAPDSNSESVVRSINVVTKAVTWSKTYDDPVWVRSLAYRTNATLLIGSNRLRYLNAMNGNTTFTSPDTLQTSIRSIAVSPDGTMAALGGFDGTLIQFDLAGQKERRLLRVFNAPLPGLRNASVVATFNTAGTRIITGDWGGMVKSWDVSTGKMTASYTASANNPITSIAMTPGPVTYYILYGGRVGSARGWNWKKELKLP
jgi:VCBS repeat-containing protein